MVAGSYLKDRLLGRILDTVEHYERSGDSLVGSPSEIGPDDETFYVHLTADLAAATDSDTPTTATAIVERPKTDDTLATGDTITLVNRFTGFSAVNGALLLVTRIGGEYVPVTPGNGDGSGSGCCCCESSTSADTILSTGEETVSTWQPCEDLTTVVVEQVHGELTITFSTPDITQLVRTVGLDQFEYTIPDTAFSAIYWDGSDATDDLDTPSGSIVFYPSVAATGCETCPQMQTVIEWDADIPAPAVSS